jgi:thymidine kinase
MRSIGVSAGAAAADAPPARADDELIVIGGMGGDDTYEARCRGCHAVVR